MSNPENGPTVSEVSICNQALSWCGEGQITSLADRSRAGEWCRNNYPFLRDAVLEDGQWTFATKRGTSSSATPDVWDVNEFVHPIPPGWISITSVWTNVMASDPRHWIPSEKWQREGDQIVSPDTQIYFSGIYRITDPDLFQPMFVQALAYRLATEMAVPLTKSRTLKADMESMYQSRLQKALARDGQQGMNRKMRVGRLIKNRGR